MSGPRIGAVRLAAELLVRTSGVQGGSLAVDDILAGPGLSCLLHEATLKLREELARATRDLDELAWLLRHATEVPPRELLERYGTVQAAAMATCELARSMSRVASPDEEGGLLLAMSLASDSEPGWETIALMCAERVAAAASELVGLPQPAPADPARVQAWHLACVRLSALVEGAQREDAPRARRDARYLDGAVRLPTEAAGWLAEQGGACYVASPWRGDEVCIWSEGSHLAELCEAYVHRGGRQGSEEDGECWEALLDARAARIDSYGALALEDDELARLGIGREDSQPLECEARGRCIALRKVARGDPHPPHAGNLE